MRAAERVEKSSIRLGPGEIEMCKSREGKNKRIEKLVTQRHSRQAKPVQGRESSGTCWMTTRAISGGSMCR